MSFDKISQLTYF